MAQCRKLVFTVVIVGATALAALAQLRHLRAGNQINALLTIGEKFLEPRFSKRAAPPLPAALVALIRDGSGDIGLWDNFEYLTVRARAILRRIRQPIQKGCLASRLRTPGR